MYTSNSYAILAALSITRNLRKSKLFLAR